MSSSDGSPHLRLVKADGEASDDASSPKADNASAGARTTPSGLSTELLFEKAVREHSRRLIAIARAIVGNRASAEDMVQQAILNLYTHRDRYDWREPGGLLRRAVVNESLRVLRQPRMSAVLDDQPEVREGRSPDEPLMGREMVQRVRQAIDELPEHFRAALVLCEYENLSYAQIAESLDASIPQVKTWLHRARKQLGEKLKGYIGAEPVGAHTKRKNIAPSAG